MMYRCVYSGPGASGIGGELPVLALGEERELSAPVFDSGEPATFEPGDVVELPPAREYTSSAPGLDPPELANGTAGGAPVDGNTGAVKVPWHNGHSIICPANWSAMVIIL